MSGYKQVIAVRTDLKMGKGKLAVQVAHGAVLGAEEVAKRNARWVEGWKREGQAKIAVKADSLEQLMHIREEAFRKGLPVVVVQDMGLTQLSQGETTCVCIGPAPSGRVDEVTNKLKLL